MNTSHSGGPRAVGIGGALRTLRLKAGMTLAQAADATGMPRSYMAHVEEGQVMPSSLWLGIVAARIVDTRWPETDS